VVERESLLRKPPHQLHGGGRMAGQDQQVVREAERSEGGDTPLEVVAQQEPIVRLVDDDRGGSP
jgi:hypothetical protein